MICVDNNALAYATEPQPDARFAEVRARLRHYFAEKRDAGTKIIIPTLVLYEYLCKYPVESHAAVRAELETNFLIFNPDAEVASVAAGLFRHREQVAAATGNPGKQARKLDVLIAATAIVAGATEILSEDRDYDAMTGGRLARRKPSSLPLPPPNLFDPQGA